MFLPVGMIGGQGTKAKPDAGLQDGPVATIGRAQQLVRKLRAASPNLKRPVVVVLRGGMYRLPETLRFEAADGGCAHSPTRYEAYKDEVPVLSGGTVISGWQVGAVVSTTRHFGNAFRW